MKLKIAFKQVGQLDTVLEGDNTNALPPALLVAHIWNMGEWMDKASLALQLYVNDLARNDENNIGDRAAYKVCDAFAYLHIKIQSLMDDVPALMDLQERGLAEAMAVCEEFDEMQAFLQPILWTDLPRSHLEITMA